MKTQTQKRRYLKEMLLLVLTLVCCGMVARFNAAPQTAAVSGRSALLPGPTLWVSR